MASANHKIVLSPSQDIPFNKLVLSQANVRRVKAGVSIEELAEDIAHRTLLQGLSVRPVRDADGNETGTYEVPAGGRRSSLLFLRPWSRRAIRSNVDRCYAARRRAVDRGDRRAGQAAQRIVKPNDRRPIDAAAEPSRDMRRLQRGLQLIATDRAKPMRAPQQNLRFLDHGAVPAPWVLLAEGNELAVRITARSRRASE